MPIVNNIVLNTYKLSKMVDLMLNVFTTKIITIKRIGEMSGGNAHVYSINCGNGFMDIYLYSNSLSCIH